MSFGSFRQTTLSALLTFHVTVTANVGLFVRVASLHGVRHGALKPQILTSRIFAEEVRVQTFMHHE